MEERHPEIRGGRSQLRPKIVKVPPAAVGIVFGKNSFGCGSSAGT
jgi:hypothetical protein